MGTSESPRTSASLGLVGRWVVLRVDRGLKGPRYLKTGSLMDLFGDPGLLLHLPSLTWLVRTSPALLD